MSENDDDLRARFATMRSSDGERVPAFERFTARRRVPTRRIAARIALAALALFVVGVSTYRAMRPAEPAHQVTLAQWRAPTDFLLRTPGSELITSSPTFASPPLERYRLP
jgi:hypothetical protein